MVVRSPSRHVAEPYRRKFVRFVDSSTELVEGDDDKRERGYVKRKASRRKKVKEEESPRSKATRT